MASDQYISQRGLGTLLPISSLPGEFGIGDLGTAAYHFVDFLKAAGQKYWQILPLDLVDGVGSPYNSCSTFAGNWYLVSPEKLLTDGLLPENTLLEKWQSKDILINYPAVKINKEKLLKESFDYFQSIDEEKLQNDFEHFCDSQSAWLADFSVYICIKNSFHGKPWYKWPREIRFREGKSLEIWQEKLAGEISFAKYCQWIFWKQWQDLHQYANNRDVKIIGDLPFFVARDSVDVWANQELFHLDPDTFPTFVAGTPPDYFQKKGQYWGYPQYDWDKMEKTGFAWWLDRFAWMLENFDLVRLDHFRGFNSLWYIRRGRHNGRSGKWVSVPGRQLFALVKERFGKLPFIAENLGSVNKAAVALGKELGITEIRILLFGFSGAADNAHRLENIRSDCVLYTGTHDNDTARGFIHRYHGSPVAKYALRRVGALREKEFAWKLIVAGANSPAEIFIVPLQDILNLGNSARMNKPGRRTKNWSWRMDDGALTPELAQRLSRLR